MPVDHTDPTSHPSTDPGTGRPADAGRVRAQEGEARGVIELVLDRPDRRNALTPGMLAELTALVDRHGPDARVLLLRGEGRSFCAGFDLDRCIDDPAELRALLDGLSGAIVALRGAQGTVVCAAHGAAIAGGCALLGGADLVVSHADARLGYPVTRLGISPAVSAPFLWHSTGGRTRHALMRPEIISGDRAHAIGLVTDLARSREDTVDHARRLASAIAAKPGGGVRATRAWLGEIESRPLPTDAARLALDASLGAVGTEEQTRMLAEAWATR